MDKISVLKLSPTYVKVEIDGEQFTRAMAGTSKPCLWCCEYKDRMYTSLSMYDRYDPLCALCALDLWREK